MIGSRTGYASDRSMHDATRYPDVGFRRKCWLTEPRAAADQCTRTTIFILGWMPHITMNVPATVKVTSVLLPGS
ncbi:hypothetical protein SAMN05444161_3095 [Rhizobiales bacterium GAS191]|nr:hypothetical protein SAMN05444161_3095 [Rhizobiales bacterium GAS191]